VLDSGARGATTTFVQREIGDVFQEDEILSRLTKALRRPVPVRKAWQAACRGAGICCISFELLTPGISAFV
jgi:hypothetical protein